MSNLILIAEDEHKIDFIKQSLSNENIDCFVIKDEKELSNYPEKFFDVILIDFNVKNFNVEMFCKKLKMTDANIQIVLIIPEGYQNEPVMKIVNGLLTDGFNSEILIATINASLRMKKSLDMLFDSNSQLAKSFYRLNVLYNISSSLAGYLDKDKLINVMIEGMEKTLNYNLSFVFVFNSETCKADLIINSLCNISERLEQALKLRVILKYNSISEADDLPYKLNFKNINVIKNIKYFNKEYDLNVLRFNSVFEKINTNDKFFGFVEVFKEEEDFSQEDTTCFQTLIKQIALPLESAMLYEEIKNTNVKLKKLEKLKSEFISIVSHELRTPLTSIKNSLDILSQTSPNETSTKFLDLAKRNVKRLSSIINDLLDFSKIEAGKMEFRFKKVQMNTPIEFISGTFENLAKEKNIEFVVNIENKLNDVYVDTNRIEQILTNLVSNAIKFTPENGKIEISCNQINSRELPVEKVLGKETKKLENNDYIKVSVKDTGLGIAEEDAEKVFDKFSQLENSLSRNIGGTGLGLPIAKQLVEAHDGFIWLESKINKGSEFSFIIPVYNEERAFSTELNFAIDKAKANDFSIAVIGLKESITEENQVSFIKNVLLNKIVNKTSHSKDFIIENEKEISYKIFIPEADKFAVDFINKKLISYFKQNNSLYNKHGILLSRVLYPEGGETALDLLDKLEIDFKELEVE